MPKVTGCGAYIGDIYFPGTLFGKVVRSPHAHAKIRRIDCTAAWEVKGVRAVITAQDTPRKRFSFIQAIADKKCLCEKKVRYVGDEVAAVAADTNSAAEEAAEKINVEYEILPSLFDPLEAMKDESILLHEDRNNIAYVIHKEFGDLQQGFKEADFVFKDTYITHKPHHACIETRGCIAQFEASGMLTVWSPTQAPHTLRQELARILDIEMAKVRVIKPLIGGSFGRGLVMDMIEPIAAILSRQTNRPVKIIKDRAEDFATSRTRYPFIVNLKTGVNKDGRIIAKQAEIVADNGAYHDKGPSVISAAGIFFTSQYNVSNVKYDAFLVYTNKQHGTAFRGFGNPQGQFAFESHLDDIAARLNIDPMQIRLLNANQPHTETATGMQIKACAMQTCIETAGKESKWHAQRSRNDNGNKRRGIGMATVLHTGSGTRYYGYNSSKAFIKVADDGSVSLITSAIDAGQGAETAMAQIAAETIGIKMENVQVISGDTALTTYDLGAFGSRTVYICGNAVKNVSEKLKASMIQLARRMLKTQGDIKIEDGFVRETISGKSVPFHDLVQYGISEAGCCMAEVGEYHDVIAPDVSLSKGYGSQIPDVVTCCYVAEVQVDIKVGSITVLDVWAVNDAGKIINRNTAEGQVEGGIVQGIGYALMENLVLENGEVVNDNFTDYKMPGANDIPRIHCFFVEELDNDGPYGAKGIGEFPIVGVAPAIGNAIYHAVGVRLKTLPFTPEKVLTALRHYRRDTLVT
jgi:putative selenate reductase molybdopterin-binding subunit